MPAGSRAELIAGIQQIKRNVEHQIQLALYDAVKIRRLLGLARMTLPDMNEALQQTVKVRNVFILSNAVPKQSL